MGTATITSAPAKDAAKFRLSNQTLFVLGLAPRSEYAVEIDDQELEFLDTDAGGTLAGAHLRQRGCGRARETARAHSVADAIK